MEMIDGRFAHSYYLILRSSISSQKRCAQFAFKLTHACFHNNLSCIVKEVYLDLKNIPSQCPHKLQIRMFDTAGLAIILRRRNKPPGFYLHFNLACMPISSRFSEVLGLVHTQISASQKHNSLFIFHPCLLTCFAQRGLHYYSTFENSSNSEKKRKSCLSNVLMQTFSRLQFGLLKHNTRLFKKKGVLNWFFVGVET